MNQFIKKIAEKNGYDDISKPPSLKNEKTKRITFDGSSEDKKWWENLRNQSAQRLRDELNQ